MGPRCTSAVAGGLANSRYHEIRFFEGEDGPLAEESSLAFADTAEPDAESVSFEDVRDTGFSTPPPVGTVVLLVEAGPAG